MKFVAIPPKILTFSPKSPKYAILRNNMHFFRPAPPPLTRWDNYLYEKNIGAQLVEKVLNIPQRGKKVCI